MSWLYAVMAGIVRSGEQLNEPELQTAAVNRASAVRNSSKFKMQPVVSATIRTDRYKLFKASLSRACTGMC